MCKKIYILVILLFLVGLSQPDAGTKKKRNSLGMSYSISREGSSVRKLDTGVRSVDTTLKKIDTTINKIDTTINRVDTRIKKVDTTLNKVDTRLKQEKKRTDRNQNPSRNSIRPKNPINPKQNKLNPIHDSTDDENSRDGLRSGRRGRMSRQEYIEEYRNFYNPNGYSDRYLQAHQGNNYLYYYRVLGRGSNRNYYGSTPVGITSAPNASIPIPDPSTDPRMLELIQQQNAQNQVVSPDRASSQSYPNSYYQTPQLISPSLFMDLPKSSPTQNSNSDNSKDFPELDTPVLELPDNQQVYFDKSSPSPQPNQKSDEQEDDGLSDAPILQSPSQILFNQGVNSLQSRNYTEARDIFRQLAKMKPESVPLQFRYGLSSFLSGDYRESVVAINQSFESANRYKTVTPSLSRVPIDQNDYKFHKQKLHKHINQNPNDVDATSLLLILGRLEQSRVTQ
jgi:hypothetical protein